MNTTELIEALIRKSSWDGREHWSAENLKNFLASVLCDHFESVYAASDDQASDGYWDAGRTVYRRVLDFPAPYISFLMMSQRHNVQLGGPYGMAIFGWPLMLESTFDYLSHGHDEDEDPRYWISMAERGDKGFIFMCCDTRSPLYGQVVEFYDGTPWACELPTAPDSDIYGDFETFMRLTLEEYGK